MSEIERLEVKRYSVHRHNTYLKCPFRFLKQIIEKVETPQTEPQRLGKSSHKYLQEYYNLVDTKQLKSLQDEDLFDYIIDLFENTIIPADEMEMDIVPVVTGFADLECDRITILQDMNLSQEEFDKYYLPVFEEREIEFDIEVPVYESRLKPGTKTVKIKETIAIVKTKFKMIVDAAFLNLGDDKHITTEWKTGLKHPDFFAEVNRQLYIYTHFLEEQKVKDKHGNKYDGKYLCVVFPRYTHVSFKERRQQSETTIMNYLGKALYSIAKGEFDRKPDMVTCGWIKPPEDRCPFYEEYCKEWLENEGYTKERPESDEDDEIDDEWREEDWNEDEKDNKSDQDFSEGSWDTAKKIGME